MSPIICLGSIVLSRGVDVKGGCEGVWLNLIIHDLLCGDTIHRCLGHPVNCGFHVSDALSFIKGDVFICKISYHYK